MDKAEGEVKLETKPVTRPHPPSRVKWFLIFDFMGNKLRHKEEKHWSFGVICSSLSLSLPKYKYNIYTAHTHHTHTHTYQQHTAYNNNIQHWRDLWSFLSVTSTLNSKWIRHPLICFSDALLFSPLNKWCSFDFPSLSLSLSLSFFLSFPWPQWTYSDPFTTSTEKKRCFFHPQFVYSSPYNRFSSH